MGMQEEIKAKLKSFQLENARTAIPNNENRISSLNKRDHLNMKQEKQLERSLKNRELYKNDPYFANKEYLKK